MDASEIVMLCVGGGVLLIGVVLMLMAITHCNDANKKRRIKSSMPDRKDEENKNINGSLVIPTAVSSKPTDASERPATTLTEVEVGLSVSYLGGSASSVQIQTTKTTEPSLLPNTQISTRPKREHSSSHFLKEMRRMGPLKEGLLRDEYQILNNSDKQRRRSCDVAAKNIDKNRYNDVLPYNDTRVLVDDEYINANYVKSNGDARRFIATQGPIGFEEEMGGKSATVDDFWQMLWEHEVQCIVMLTSHFEDGIQKCGYYWPPLVGETRCYGKVRVRLATETEHVDYVRRELDVSVQKELRHLSHFQFLGWRDAQKVDCERRIVHFMNVIRESNFCSPLVVHCSAGVGRTGVFICAENVLARAAIDGIVDVFSEANQLRQQRSKMIQTPQQYISVYDIVALALRQSAAVD